MSQSVIPPSKHVEHTSEDALKAAGELISGARHADYGTAYDDFSRTAGMWTALLRDKLKPGAVIGPADVGWMMTMLKASRQQNHHKEDNFVDAIGYLALAYEIACFEANK